MNPVTYEWISPATGATMPVRRFGETGQPVVYIPTSGGDEAEFESYEMQHVARSWIEAGKIQVFAIDGWGPKSLFDDARTPEERVHRYVAFERYARDELLPWLEQATQSKQLHVLGASYGAFVAANLLFKRFDRIRLAFGLGGVYGLWHRLDGFHTDDVYFHTPLEYMPRLEDPAILNGIRRTGGLRMYAAADDPWLSSTQRMAQVLEQLQLPMHVEVWPSPANHHERWWRDQLRDLLSRHY